MSENFEEPEPEEAQFLPPNRTKVFYGYLFFISSFSILISFPIKFHFLIMVFGAVG